VSEGRTNSFRKLVNRLIEADGGFVAIGIFSTQIR